MFHSKTKKSYALLLPKATRIVIILHLCFLFSFAAWCSLKPFLEEYYTVQKKNILYKTVFGDLSLSNERGFNVNLLKRNQERFNSLPGKHQAKILDDYHKLQKRASLTFTEKTKRALHILIFDLPPFIKAWMFFSFFTSIFILLRVEGATLSAWLLPIITAIYAFNNLYFAPIAPPSVDQQLFPSENTIISKYLKEPLSSKISEQKEQLLKGWHLYLIQEWNKENPSISQEKFDLQVESGLFSFNIERLTLMEKQKKMSDSTLFSYKQFPFLLLIYLMWNLFFAAFVNRKKALDIVS